MRRNCSPVILLFTILMLLSAISFGQSSSGVLAPSRALDWTQTGVPGGVPSGSWANCVTTACNTLYGGSVTSSTINAALASAPDNTVVRIPAGTFSLTGNTYSNRSRVVLRGAGPGKTKINTNGHDIYMGGYGTSGQGSTPGGLGVKTLNTLSKGSTVLSLNSTTGLSAGQIVFIDEHNNTGYVNVNGNEGVDAATRCDSPLGFFGCSVRAQSEMVQIVSVDSSTQITITPGLSKTYSSGLAPQVFYWNNSGDVSYDGVEDLTLNQNVDYGISFVFCHFCWAKNVAVVNPNSLRSNIYFFFSYRGEVRDSYISASNSAGAPTEYGIEMDRAGRSKIENNIFFGLTTPVQLMSSTGIVVGYNYILRTANDVIFPTIDTHRAHNYGFLFEGNTAAFLDFDFVWGSASHNTAFRDRFSGYDPNSTGYQIAINADYFNRYMNFVGNVLGQSGVQTKYECSKVNPQPTENYVFGIGGYNGCAGNSNNDDVVRTSMMRWGNWDSVTNAVRWNSSEVPSSDANFSNPVPSSQTLPNSFYLSSRPGWFVTPYGTPAWPPIGPDVSGGNIANTGGHANKIPAQLCYENTTKNSGGFLTAFDAKACYSSSSSSSVQPASGLSVVVH